MKPLNLVMQAFGPYPGREEIDFNELSKAGIFLIKGPTGSGKTTIFDAMSIALYGKSTGEEDSSKTGRNKFEIWRCNQAKKDVDTIVEFTFEANGNIYRFTRKLIQKRVKLDQVNSLSMMDENGIFQEIDENPKNAVLNDKAEELIGLNSNQFRQVVLLPQGQFERFLTADSNEKEQILSRLFDASEWGNYASRLCDKASERKSFLVSEKEKIDFSLSEEKKGFSRLDELFTYIEELKEKLKEIEESYVSFDFNGKRNQLENDRELSNKYEILHTLEKKKSELESEAERMEANKNRLANADRANSVRDSIISFENLLSNYHECKKKLDQANSLTEELKKTEKDAKDRLDKIIEDSIVDDCNKQIALFEAKREIYEKIDLLFAQMNALQNALREAKKEYSKKEEVLKKATENAKIKYAKSNEADDIAKQCRIKYYAGIYGEIASKLADDMPCPVCGSTNHPSLAKRNAESISKEEMEAAETAAEMAKKEWENAENLRSDAEIQKSEAEKLLNEEEKNFNTAETIYKESANGLIEGIESTRILDDKIQKLKEKIDNYNSSLEKLRNEYEAAHDRLSTHIATLDNYTEAFENARTLYEADSEKLNKLLADNGYSDIESAKNDQLSDEERKAILRIITEYDTHVKNNQEDIKKQSELLAGTIEPDKASFSLRQKEIDEEVQTYTEAKTRLSKEIERLSAKYKDLKKKQEHYDMNYQEADADLSFAKNLRGDSGIGLQRYVLGIMFDQIIVEANRMLQMVHEGRYRLRRTDEKGSGNKRGLELVVYDNRMPDEKGRPVSSLSGGEKFLVSLSLSIGMSTIAQKSGLHIESLFIDEGFGTLDDNSISDAMNILEQVQKSNGMIGIISHVSILENTISKHIEIVKSNAGSRIKSC